MANAEISREWWAEDHLADAVVGVVHRSRQEDENRLNRIRQDVGFYINRELAHLDAWAYSQWVRSPTKVAEDGEDPRITLARSVVDTIHAKMTKNPPRTKPVTNGATWTLQRRGERLGQFLDGVKYRNNWRQLFPLVVRDAQIAAEGFVKVRSAIHDNVGRIHLDRVLPWELRVDPMEATYGKPRSLFHECLMDRRVAAATWPKHAKAILNDGKRAQRGEGHTGYRTHADPVCVIEAWHLPSAPGAKDGRRVIVIEGVKKPVEVAAWERDHFPIVGLSWSEPLMGYWGHSLLEEIRGLHLSINELDEAIRERTKQSMVFATTTNEEIQKVASNDLHLDVFKVMPGETNPFEVHVPAMNNPEAYAERDNLLRLGYQMPGVSQLSAQSMKPAGLNAGVALREYQDIESERFAAFGRAIETFDLEVSKRIIAEARDLAELGVDVEVRARAQKRRRSVLAKLNFKDVNMDEDAYELQVMPANQLPRTPAGRLAMVEQLIAAGFLEKQDALRLLDIPDVESVMSESLAPYYVALDMVELMLEDKRQVSPIPEMDLDTASRVVRIAILQAEIDEVP
ncbi:MAG: hypothetical protein ACIAQU_07535, partial [Phycisphaerales bacterium JB064]